MTDSKKLLKTYINSFFRLFQGAPYLMEVTDGQQRGYLIENKYYEGYCIDLIAAIAEQLGFKYQYELVPGPYNGLINRLVERVCKTFCIRKII